MSDRDWAAEHAPRLLEEARAEALADAKEILRRRLVDELLDAARTPTAPPPPPRPTMSSPGATTSSDRVTGSPAPPKTSSGRAIWVYGIVDPTVVPDDLRGVDGAPVEAIETAGLAALSSPVPLDRFGAEVLQASLEDLERLEALARAHEGVLARALELGGVVPFRLCTIYDDADHVRKMLEGERASLRAALDRVRGMAEWGVKGYLTDVPAPEPATAASGTAWLERKREDRAAAERAQEVAEHRMATIHARLAEHAAAATLSRPQDRRLSGHEGEMLLNASYLVEKARAADFGAVVEALGREHEPHGVRLELTGPWAAYHFVGSEG